MNEYHDREWGVPQRDDKILFEYVVLDTFQAGLSWQIILRKRENFRRAFSNFNPRIIAHYDDKKVKQLLIDAGIIRNRLKILGTIRNAQSFLKVQREFGSFATYFWSFVNNKTIDHQLKHDSRIASRSKESDALSLDMKRRGFAFVGTIVCYAFMQGAGLVNDHVTTCFRHGEVKLTR